MQNYYYSIGGFISEAKSQLYYIYIPKYIPGINEPFVFKLYFYGNIDN